MMIPRVMFRIPPAAWIIAMLLGLGAGFGAFALIYGRGHAYLTNDPRACVQCHVMNKQFDAWSGSTHRFAADCNSCHAPADFVGKYFSKAVNGFNHSLAFTTGEFVEPIRIKEWNLRIAEKNCVRCHQSLWDSPRSVHPQGENSMRCTHCHKQVGHPH